jgi:hypothetical protein
MSKKIHIAYDENGRIVAAVEIAPPGEQPGPRPTEGPGVSVGEFEVPAEFADKKMIEYVDLLRVDAAARQLVKR